MNSQNHPRSNLFVHVGAPRTGSSFLREHVFPKLSNVHFESKQRVQSSLSSSFARLAHYGDGDELSNSIDAKVLQLPEGKCLISEEHFLWSVHHMFGNVASRAFVLKSACPDAKIILTIRRQPEFLFSVFKYLQQLDRSNLGRQLTSVSNMVNVERNFQECSIQSIGPIPCGIQTHENYCAFDIHSKYFVRPWRHFIAADFSWLKLVNIYEHFFGPGNVLVVPQELWSTNGQLGISLIENFIGETITDRNAIPFEASVNASRDVSLFPNAKTKENFIACVMKEVVDSNRCLDRKLPDVDLGKLGYDAVPEQIPFVRLIGFKGTNAVQTSSRMTKALETVCKERRRRGVFPTMRMIARATVPRVFRFAFLKQSAYRIAIGAIDSVKGLDFQKIETTSELQLDPSESEQYESSKVCELRKTFAQIDLPKDLVAIDVGSGKGQVLAFLSGLPGVEKVYGVEISANLHAVANANLNQLGISIVELIHADARDLPTKVIDECNLFYFYNPFPKKVFDEVISAISASVAKRQCDDCILVYFNPVHEQTVLSTGSFVVESEVRNQVSSAKTIIFRSRPSRTSADALSEQQ